LSSDEEELRTRLRRSLRRRRAAHSPDDRAADARRIAEHLLARIEVLHPRTLAAYWADEGEPDLGPLLEEAHRRGVGLALPAPFGRMLHFVRWSPGAPLQAARFGIPVPVEGVRIKPTELDWVLVPLVAFTVRGQRLGRGGGFYDRTFARRSPGGPPLLIGVAYAWQEVESLPRAPWDVDLDAVVTPEGWRDCRAGIPRENDP
jgi:5-formyltetrahydrofolate cyclo-ligase